jgi:hypothetical protein
LIKHVEEATAGEKMITSSSRVPKSPKSKSLEPRASTKDNAALYKILRNLNSKNLEGKKNEMKNKLNDVQARANQK